MAEVVEFSINEQTKAKDDETKQMLVEILDELKGKKREDIVAPRLKLVRFDDSA